MSKKEGRDEVLVSIEVQQIQLEYERKKRLKQLAYKEGRAAASLDALVCEHHKGAGFAKTGTIEGSYTFSGDLSPLKTYECKGCQKDESLDLFQRTKVYECNICGFVKGEPVRQPYNELGMLSGSAGERLYCEVCSSRLGEEEHECS
ncbi:hypothetical protein JW711_04395 [Candidatus Woesearchaeota archaeon]|nr:hypothetical protein [Candidatus Woesearchaeota archaeon]